MAVIDLKPLTRKEARVVNELVDVMRGALDRLVEEDRDTGPMLRVRDVLSTLQRALDERAALPPHRRLLAPYGQPERPHVHTYLAEQLDTMKLIMDRWDWR